MIFNKMVDSSATIIEKIHAHPFNQALMQGTLSKNQFIFYLTQDALYLADFSRALALTAARLPNHHHMQAFIEFTRGAIQAERELHSGYMKQYQTETSSIAHFTLEQSPSCFMYSNYILKMASLASVEEAVASLLPCFFVYNEVGKNMLSNHQPNNPYHAWIALYSSEAFELSVQSAIEITNALAHNTSAVVQEKMIAAFIRSTQLEWLFWESAYRQEQWLVMN